MMHNTVRILGALRAQSRPACAATLLGIGLLLCACGQKGPLFLPPPTVKPAPAKAQVIEPPKDETRVSVEPTD